MYFRVFPMYCETTQYEGGKFIQIDTETNLLLLASDRHSRGNCGCDSTAEKTDCGLIFAALFEAVFERHRGRDPIQRRGRGLD